MKNKLIEVKQNEMLAPQQNLYENPAFIQSVKSNIAKGASDPELQYFLTACQSLKLNPLNKEIYFMASGEGENRKVSVMVGAIGMRKRAMEYPDFISLKYSDVRTKDIFEYSPIDGLIKHEIGRQRGELEGAWALSKRKGYEDVFVYCSLQDYKKTDKDGKLAGAWRNNTVDMMLYKPIKRALDAHYPTAFDGVVTNFSDFECEDLSSDVNEGRDFPAESPKLITLDDMLSEDE